MTNVLDIIDAALGERCACGCGQAVLPGGASAWFAAPDCQRKWHAAGAAPSWPHDLTDAARARRASRASLAPTPVVDLSPADVEAVSRNIGAVWRDLVERLQPAMDALAAVCRELEPKLKQLAATCQQHARKPLPTDPMLRAIEVKKRRGRHGPARPTRAPRMLGRRR